MPSFATAVAIDDSADSVRVALKARFVLVAGSPSDITYALKGRVPDGIDVVLHSDLVISISGTMDRARVDSRAIQSSAIAQHLQNYFHMNGEQLGVRIASKIFVDDDDNGKVKLTLSPTRPVLERCSPFLRLSAIELVYVCKNSPTPHAHPQSGHVGVEEASPAADPFSPHGFLPLVAALDRIIDRFVVLHLVRKFPLIFGPWRERFDAEVAVSRKVARAITDIVARSPHIPFRKKCHRLIKAMRKNAVHTAHASADSLRALLSEAVGEEDRDEVDDLAGPEGSVYASSDNCDVLCQAMERLLRRAVKPQRYKSTLSPGVKQGSVKTLDDDFCLLDCRSTSPVTFQPLHHDVGQDVRDRVELCFDEDTDSLSGSQDQNILYGDDADLDDVDLLVSDEAESFCAIGPPLEDVDDIWGSTQSTLDDPFSDLEDYAFSSSQPCSTTTAFSDHPRRFMDDMFFDEAEDGWFDNLAPTPDYFECSSGPLSGALSQTSPLSSSPFSQPSSQHRDEGFFQSCESSALGLSGTSTAPRFESHDLHSQAFSPSVDEALEVTTSYFPIAMDDDLACDSDGGMASSRMFFAATPVLSPPPLDAVAEGSELLEFDSEFEVPLSEAQGSLDGWNLPGYSLSSTPHSRSPPARESACVAAVVGNFHDEQEVEAAARLRTLVCSASSADENPSALVPWVIDVDGDGQVGQRDGENEGSLVAGDAGHATAIRAGPGEEACAGEGARAGLFLAEPAGMHMVLRWEEFDEGGNEGDMLCFE